MLSLDYSKIQPWLYVDRVVNIPIKSRLIKGSYVLFLLILTFPYLEFAAIPTAGIDNSWRIALELVAAKHLTWGKDIIYTYGPLGHWLQRYIITTSRLELFLVDLFMSINLFALLYSLLPSPLKLWHFGLSFFVWAMINSMYGEWIHFMWFYWVIYWGVYSLDKPNKLFPYYLIVLGTINFYMKTNWGLIALVFVASLLSYNWYAKQYTLKQTLLHLGCLFASVLAGAAWLHTDLIAYLKSSLYIISGYNESQAYYPAYRLRCIVTAYGSYGLCLVSAATYIGNTFLYSYRKTTRAQQHTIFSLVWFSFIGFVLLKYAFTRADDGHITAYIKLSSLMLVLVIATVPSHRIRNIFFGYLLINFACYIAFYTSLFGPISTNYGSTFSGRLYLVKQYVQQSFTRDYPAPKPTIPAALRRKIGRRTVDAVPHELSDIYFNQLNYNPRPVIQSYQAYNGYLDSINRAKYLSPTAPDWIIYQYESMDGKYPLADETQTLLAILQRYSVVDRTSNRLFLRRNRRARPLRLISESTSVLQMGQKLPVPRSGGSSVLHVLYARTHYNLYGQALKIFFQPPQLTMTIRAEDGSAKPYRTVPTLLEKGVILNARVDDLDEAQKFLNTQRVSHKRVTDVVLDQVVRGQPGFSPLIDVTIRSYRLEGRFTDSERTTAPAKASGAALRRAHRPR